MALDQTVPQPTPSDAPTSNPGMIAAAVQQQQTPPSGQPQATGQPMAQPAASQPAQPTQPVQAVPQGVPASQIPAGTTFKNLSHSFMGALLGHLAGEPPTQYTANAQGQVVPVPQPKLTATDRMRMIATRALTGMAAGANAPQQKSAAASAFAGLGAGASAEQQKTLAAEQQSKKEAAENWEREQQQTLQKANIAHGNAAAYQNHVHAMNEEMDRDPERGKNLELAKGAEDAGLDVQYMSEHDAMARMAADHNFTSTHLVRGIGMKPETDNDGNPVMDADGTPHYVGQVVVINGMQDGQMPLTKSLAADVQKYGNIVGIGNADSIKEGDTVPLNMVIRLEGLAQEGKKKEMEGWQNPDPNKDLILAGPDGKTPYQRNRITGETRPLFGGVPVETAKTKAQTDEAAAATQKNLADAIKARADANKANADAAMGGEKGLQPVLAYDSQNKPHIESAAVAAQLGHKNPMKASDKDYNDAITGHTVLNVIQNGINNVAATAPAALGQDTIQRAIIGQALSHPKDSTYDNLVRAGVMKGATPQTQSYIQSVLSLREQALGYNKELTNTGRVSDVAVNALWNTLPSTTGDEKYVNSQLDKFQQSLDTLRKKFPVVQGVEVQGPQAAQPTQPAQSTRPTTTQSPLSGQIAPQTHLFSPAAWQKTHPGQDVNQAIAAATRKGYQVTQ